MDKERVFEIAHFFKSCLEEKGVRVSKLILFGSQAALTAGDESDIDLAVVSKDFEGQSLLKRIELTGKAEWETIKKFVVPLDVIGLTPGEFDNETRLIVSYAKKGIEV